ncbi:hypothetical protein CYY_007485 [Polysphondylium violaceum]|uniref:Uncharacterized protein n=1 Tax=Polysphondylium violaceum TaxID=133409 RepID=A0A8J4PPL5_9MYCE|nr:hypothetical protein CYY_007485 [Polysphondylium violaceum]
MVGKSIDFWNYQHSIYIETILNHTIELKNQQNQFKKVLEEANLKIESLEKQLKIQKHEHDNNQKEIVELTDKLAEKTKQKRKLEELYTSLKENRKIFHNNHTDNQEIIDHSNNRDNDFSYQTNLGLKFDKNQGKLPNFFKKNQGDSSARMERLSPIDKHILKQSPIKSNFINNNNNSCNRSPNINKTKSPLNENSFYQDKRVIMSTPQKLIPKTKPLLDKFSMIHKNTPVRKTPTNYN